MVQPVLVQMLRRPPGIRDFPADYFYLGISNQFLKGRIDIADGCIGIGQDYGIR